MVFFRKMLAEKKINFDQIVFCLDFDDTLIEPQDNPVFFDIPSDLRDLFIQLIQEKKLRIVLVTGRSVNQIDSFFSPLRFPVIGCHGCELRLNPEKGREDLFPPIPDGLQEQIFTILQKNSEIIFENKNYVFTIHFPNKHSRELERSIHDIVAKYDSYKIVSFTSGLEIRPLNMSKGFAISHVFKHDPLFQGQTPVYIGDDVGSDDSLNVLAEFGGFLIGVSKENNSEKENLFRNPQHVRNFLRSLLQPAL